MALDRASIEATSPQHAGDRTRQQARPHRLGRSLARSRISAEDSGPWGVTRAAANVGSAEVKGPLNTPRPPQGHPVIVQAGTSNDGMDVAARFAEVIFSANLTIESCQKYFREVKARAQDKFGRNPDHLKVMPGLSCYVGRTEEEAKEKYDYQNSLMHPIVAREQVGPWMTRRGAATLPPCTNV